MTELELEEGFYLLPRGTLPSLVVCLEMTERPPPRHCRPPDGVSLRHVHQPDLDWYRALFTKVGEPWVWYGRRLLTDDRLRAVIHDPKIEVRVVEHHGSPEGLMELDFRKDGEVELAYFGLADALIGSGAGRWLMEEAITQAFHAPIRRFWVHTCNWDHKAALAFYQRSGFKPYRFALDLDPDPRLTGVLPRSAGPHAPIIEAG
ncbi:MAG TPA: GNAT family N-acetyltransferase [Geminicoccus sp.]|jgi:GNAT superfamily N-acetyltransferase|uniref:GNAT family N-acetyltransferase n=1 Tax=Geminicoccus sp. TaxID=2024832 RepID=UPI002E342E65|nr:GNAT family N-acetyltransferase [Geminicoccus sp.]HEX2525927.1 GNAT family N-acetyltransferase [Geminicoccus sp.]